MDITKGIKGKVYNKKLHIYEKLYHWFGIPDYLLHFF